MALPVASTVVTSFLYLCTNHDDEDDLLFSANKKRKHDFWMAEYLHDRTKQGETNTLAKLDASLLRLGFHEEFRASLRMTQTEYLMLLEKIRPAIYRQHTNYRLAITPEERLTLTLRYLSLGDSVTTLHLAYLIGRSTILPIVRDTCRAIAEALSGEYLKVPDTREAWEGIAAGFYNRWNFPNTLGAVDGKHIRIRRPLKSGSLYYNYKHFYSVVLLAVVGPEYEFLYVDAGAEGRSSDSGLWRHSDFYRDVQSPANPLNIPPPLPLPGTDTRMPHFFVGDDAFALSPNLMKPFPSTHLEREERIFNYRLSRCRRIVENAFGILAARFRIFRREQDMEPAGVKPVIMAAVVLHNFLRARSPLGYIPTGSKDHFQDDARDVYLPLQPATPSKRAHSRYVKNLRTNLKDWCVSPAGALSWQNKAAFA